MGAELVSARTIDDTRLAELFTDVYAGYWHPVEVDASTLRRMATIYDFDLEASVVALDGDEPVGVAMLAARGAEGWVGGMGVLPEHRGTGLGEQLMRRLIGEARDRGVTRLLLEVLVQNRPAIAIYRRLGFTDLGDVAVWRLDTPPEAAPAAKAATDDALAELSARAVDTPWQRNPATVANMRGLGSEIWAARADGGVALFATGAATSVLELEASSREAAAALLAAPFAGGADAVIWGNGPTEGITTEALVAAGAAEVARQHHLVLAL